jgi:diketogulonate reductase-like aldo/keto reductase
VKWQEAEGHRWNEPDRLLAKRVVDMFLLLKQLRKLVQGKHRFHNFSPGMVAGEDRSLRRIFKFRAKAKLVPVLSTADEAARPAPSGVGGGSAEEGGARHVPTGRSLPCVCFSFIGQSFVRSQVRGLVGVIAAITRGIVDADYLEYALGDNVVAVPFAPAAGLLFVGGYYDAYELGEQAQLRPRRTKYMKGLVVGADSADVSTGEAGVLSAASAAAVAAGASEVAAATASAAAIAAAKAINGDTQDEDEDEGELDRAGLLDRAIHSLLQENPHTQVKAALQAIKKAAPVQWRTLKKVEVVDALLRARGGEEKEEKKMKHEDDDEVLDSEGRPVYWNTSGHDQNQPSESASPGSALMVQRVTRWRTKVESAIMARELGGKIFTSWAEGKTKACEGMAAEEVEDMEAGTSESGPLLEDPRLSLHALAPLLRRELNRCREQRAVLSSAGASGASVLRERVQAQRAVPECYVEVLRLLRLAEHSGKWPKSTKRRLRVIANAAENKNQGETKGVGSGQEQKQKQKQGRSKGKAEAEGENQPPAEDAQTGQDLGGAASFSFGLMPPPLRTPSMSFVFPELLRAVIKLEATLAPERQPQSTTITVNKHARFRAHRDSGGGAGQGISMIVGVGEYAGGELVVEGYTKEKTGEKQSGREEKESENSAGSTPGEEGGEPVTTMPIRYSPAQFNGWKQTHWTLPFSGERYSLVWFTPLGCEEMDIERDLFASGKIAAGGAAEGAAGGVNDDTCVVLSNGVRMPLLGLGTYTLRGQQCEDTVRCAVGECGYRLVDTAFSYKNHAQVARALGSLLRGACVEGIELEELEELGDETEGKKDAGDSEGRPKRQRTAKEADNTNSDVGKGRKLSRADVWLTSKLMMEGDGDSAGVAVDSKDANGTQTGALEAAYRCGLECITQLNRQLRSEKSEGGSEDGANGDSGVDGGYVDMLLLHWPGPKGAKLLPTEQAQAPEQEAAAAQWRLDSWLALQQLYLEGRCRAIGVSNFEIRHLEDLLQSPLVTVAPHVNQVECHVRLQQRELREWCARKGVTVQAHTPLGKGQLVQEGGSSDSTKGSAHSLLQWAAGEQLPIVVRSNNPDHLRQNAQSMLCGKQGESTEPGTELPATSEHRFAWDPTRVI